MAEKTTDIKDSNVYFEVDHKENLMSKVGALVVESVEKPKKKLTKKKIPYIRLSA